MHFQHFSPWIIDKNFTLVSVVRRAICAAPTATTPCRRRRLGIAHCSRTRSAAGELQQRVVEIETLIPSKSNRGEIIRSVNRGTGVARNKMRDKRAGGRATANCAARCDAARLCAARCARIAAIARPPPPPWARCCAAVAAAALIRWHTVDGDHK